MEKTHIFSDNGAAHCGAIEGGFIHFSHFRQKMREDVNAIDTICDVCSSKENTTPRFPTPIDPDKVTVRVDILSAQSSTAPEEFGFQGNHMPNLPTDVKGCVSDIVLGVGYADSTLHRIYPLLFCGKKAPGCNLDYPKKVIDPEEVRRLVWDNHSGACNVRGGPMFKKLSKGNPTWHPNTKALVADACSFEQTARKVRNMLGHPWLIWEDRPISVGGRPNPYIPFTSFQLSDGKETAMPLSVEALRDYANASDKLAKTLSELRRQVTGI